MRRAGSADRAHVERIVRDRFAWMAARGFEAWPRSPVDVASTVSSGRVWVLADTADIPVAVTTVLTRTGTAVFSAAEREQSCLVLVNTVTDPVVAGRRLGECVALWAVDRASSTGRQWVRRVTTEQRLVEYYQSQGFTLVRRRVFNGRLVSALQRQAERLAVLPTVE